MHPTLIDFGFFQLPTYGVLLATAVVVSLWTLRIRAEANCTLILVSDESGQLKEAPHILERRSNSSGYIQLHPLAQDTATNFYYAYFRPDPVPDDPSAFLWLYGRDQDFQEGGLSTTRFKLGYQYFISILE